MGALRAGARLFFLAISLNSRSIPGLRLASTQSVESGAYNLFPRTICIQEWPALDQALEKTSPSSQGPGCRRAIPLPRSLLRPQALFCWPIPAPALQLARHGHDAGDSFAAYLEGALQGLEEDASVITLDGVGERSRVWVLELLPVLVGEGCVENLESWKMRDWRLGVS
jgi:hypothetical protein